jgi:hypothetical protein
VASTAARHNGKDTRQEARRARSTGLAAVVTGTDEVSLELASPCMGFLLRSG